MYFHHSWVKYTGKLSIRAYFYQEESKYEAKITTLSLRTWIYKSCKKEIRGKYKE